MSYTAERVRSRHPFEIFFIYVVLLTSIVGLATRAARPGSIQEGLGTAGTIIWYCALLAGGITALAGIFWRERATGLTLEAVGLFVTGLATIFYGAAALLIIGLSASYAAISLFGYGAAAIWRARQIRRLLISVAREPSVDSQG